MRKSVSVMVLLVVLAVIAAIWTAQIKRGRVAGATELFVPATFWQYQCLDTMKFSRDTAGAQLDDLAKAQSFVQSEVSLVKSLGANCIALGTPYDERFIPVLKLWVNEARKQDLAVWFRGNFSGWESWFGYAKFSSADEHHKLLYNMITTHPDLFKPWDILTPAPEAENGLLGNPWRSPEAAEQLRQFVKTSSQACSRAQADAGISFRCGYFSANGDVAERIYDAETTQAAGGAVVMDHYVSTSERMENDIIRVSGSHGAAVMLGEFGAPIPDINGPMSESQQAELVGQLLEVFRRNRGIIGGINYWVLRGGSTSLVNEPDNSLRLATEVLARYYQPGRVLGRVIDTRGRPVAGATVTIGPSGDQLITDASGQFGSPVLAGQISVSVQHPAYLESETSLPIEPSQASRVDFVLRPAQKTAAYWVEELIHTVRQ